MFDFIKKLKPVYEIPEPLSVRERALKVFSRIEGLDDIPACAKSLFMLQIEKYMSSKVYFAEGASTTKAGLHTYIAERDYHY
jgi:hypothetical protein